MNKLVHLSWAELFILSPMPTAHSFVKLYIKLSNTVDKGVERVIPKYWHSILKNVRKQSDSMLPFDFGEHSETTGCTDRLSIRVIHFLNSPINIYKCPCFSNPGFFVLFVLNTQLHYITVRRENCSCLLAVKSTIVKRHLENKTARFLTQTNSRT